MLSLLFSSWSDIYDNTVLLDSKLLLCNVPTTSSLLCGVLHTQDGIYMVFWNFGTPAHTRTIREALATLQHTTQYSKQNQGPWSPGVGPDGSRQREHSLYLAGLVIFHLHPYAKVKNYVLTCCLEACFVTGK